MGSHSVRHIKAFKTWFAADRSFRLACQTLGTPERTLRYWAEKEDWHLRGDLLDREVQRRADKAAIEAAVARRIAIIRKVWDREE
jgi:hypothetical protein